MKGIVLAGGTGTRLKPLTLSVNKHLLPIYDQPMIYWPVITLVRMGIGEILIVANEDDVPRYEKIFDDGAALGVSISYATQKEADGVAGALRVAEAFAAGDSIAVILGDNIFTDAIEMREAVETFRAYKEKGAMVFLKEVPDPHRFGVAHIEGDRVLSIEEKPAVPASNLAVTGLYFFDQNAFNVVRALKPSARGELEITDVNNVYIAQGTLRFQSLSTQWIDAGTHESLFQANLVAAGMDYEAKKKLKIAFGVNNLSVGGAEHLVLHQIARINLDRYDPYLITLLPSTPHNLNAEAARIKGRWAQFAFGGFWDVREWWKLYRFLRREKFDVVVTTLFFTCTVLRIAAWVARVPVILSNEVTVDPGTSRWKVLVEKMLAQVTDKYIANSKEVVASVSRRLKLAKGRVVLIYSGIDLRAHNDALSTSDRDELRHKHRCKPGVITITTAGSLSEQKGHRYLIEAFALLRRRVSMPVRLIIFGEGKLRDDLLHQIKDLGLQNNVELPGVAPLPEIIAVSDIFVLPSLWEGMSLMLLEAMAGSKPIVATDVSGSRELITDKENGFLVPPKDVEALADKLGILVNDRDLRTTFARASLKEVQKFSIESNLNGLYAVINKAMRKKKSKTHARGA